MPKKGGARAGGAESGKRVDEDVDHRRRGEERGGDSRRGMGEQKTRWEAAIRPRSPGTDVHELASIPVFITYSLRALLS